MSYPQISNQNRKEVAIMVSILQQIYAGGLAPICDAMPRVREYQEALQEQFLMGFRLGARLMIEVLDQPET